MSLTPGTRFGAFEVSSLLGSGGMGEVYRAHDTRLGREVALKVIPAALAGDPGRLERFDREARALAALNHPGIAAIYSVEDVEGTRALVLELVEGDTLEDRLKRGPLRLDETMRIGRAVADALDAAHERGLVHRDVKPANIKITSAGDVKILDFGIAKILHTSDTATMTGTAHGAIIGTAAYMSPEQARGSAVDKRTDVWSFGCVLYEMLTGVAPFRGATWSDSISLTLTEDPDWPRLESVAPLNIFEIVRRCLQKEQSQRLRGLGGVDLAFSAPSAARPIRGRTRPIIIGTAVAAMALALLAAAWSMRPSPSSSDARVVRFEIPPSVRVAESGSFAISPDGARLAFVGTGADGILRLWERTLDSLQATPVNGTEGEIAGNSTLFWSYDGRSIGFYADGAVQRIAREGGVSQVVCRISGIAVGGSWNSRDEIVVGNTNGGLTRCPASGGSPTPVTADDGRSVGVDREMLHLFPSFLPDGRHVLYLRVSRTEPSRNGLYLADVTKAPADQPAQRIIETGFSARFTPSANGPGGRILFVRNRGVWAVPFDSERLTVTGEAVPIVASVGTFRDGAFFDATDDIFVHRGGTADYQLSWRDRKGTDLGGVGEPGLYLGVALSPDGTRAAVSRENQLNRSDQDLLLIDLRRNAMTRFTSDPNPESIPAWSSDGNALLFAVGHDKADIRWRPISGAAERTLLAGSDLKSMSVNPILTTITVSADGRLVAFTMDTRNRSRADIWTLRMGEGGPKPLIGGEFDQSQPALSPDGRWLAYVSNDSGANEVLLRPLVTSGDGGPTVGGPIPVSRGGGRSPRWRADSGELYFQAADGSVMAARVVRDTIDEPVRLFVVQGALAEWGVAPGGDRFLFALPAAAQTLPFGVVMNWQTELK